MHELSLCQALLDQVERVAQDHGATRVDRILLKVGPLSGVEPSLLQHAYPLAAAGTIAEAAELVIEPAEVRVRCLDCGAETDAQPNRLLCGACDSFKTRLISGDEMLLANLELTIPDDEPTVGVPTDAFHQRKR
ncbi:hydrogenase maturation nickel metallochaperone HypA [Thiorhodococcus mannitoliphagus]|uniref:Hydrogenase maturation factor HypA n=1 Tax=Thiorhodococcus mannitoliphagus TaxID=329406 RepID=A0A6P1DRN8_9GAMM|nr:hydrogenase maturation nickel metallochaperone HypA [Thiorhodococcus mannitoliphagus]NEX19346.1 hydrogenase maturation nickel metallochaperone HypA [Thiorhodococcus mannitoliphagus]